MALGPLLTDARRRLAIQPHSIADQDVRVPIPLSDFQQMLQISHRHYRVLVWQPDTLVRIKIFRAILAVCSNYRRFCCAETGVRSHVDDTADDITGVNMLLFVGKAKGDQRRTAADKPLL
jgi:hypothetical protein